MALNHRLIKYDNDYFLSISDCFDFALNSLFPNPRLEKKESHAL